MPTDPLFYAVGLPATFLIALGKGAFGGGLAILGIPLLALAIDPIAAAIVTAMLVSAMDLFALQAFPRRTWSLPDLAWLAPGLLAGLGIGFLVLIWVDPRWVALLIAVVTLWFTARWFLRDRHRQVSGRPIAPAKALACGALGGFTTFIAHAGGPPVAIYLLPRGLPKSVYAGTTIALFTLGNAIKLVPYVWLGLRQPDVMWQALALLPAAPAGVIVGKIVHDRLDERRIYLFCYVLVAAAGLNLLATSLRQLLAG